MFKKTCCNQLILIMLFTLLPLTYAQAKPSYTQLITDVNLTEVANTIDLKNDDTSWPILNNIELSQKEKQSSVLLMRLGCITAKDINQLPQTTSVTGCNALKPLSIDYPAVPKHLTSTLNQLLKDSVIEGYNIKAKALVTSNKSGKNIILYGHSSLAHAKQLITLLTINDIDFTWQLIAKSSAFNIRENWQDTQPEEQLSTIRIAKEYDVRFNFADQAEQQRFMPLINQFAKKDSENEIGLIVDAWWQPFYRTFLPQEAFIAVKRISLQADGFIASTLALKPNLNKVLKKINTSLLQTKANVLVSSEDVWVNPAFYRYLNGDYQ